MLVFVAIKSGVGSLELVLSEVETQCRSTCHVPILIQKLQCILQHADNGRKLIIGKLKYQLLKLGN